jgi:hypothetical protein
MDTCIFIVSGMCREHCKKCVSDFQGRFIPAATSCRRHLLTRSISSSINIQCKQDNAHVATATTGAWPPNTATTMSTTRSGRPSSAS